MFVADHKLQETARHYKEELMAKMFGISAQTVATTSEPVVSALPLGSSIIGVGYGARSTMGNELEGEVAVRVYVRSKLPKSQLSSADRIPTTVNGLPTDVVPVGDVSALGRTFACGVSVGHYNIAAGTLGCLVKSADGNNDQHYILSNNHVLANANNAVIGDKILAPAPLDGGDLNDPIAELIDYEPLQLGEGINLMDAALAKVLDSVSITPDILQIGSVEQPIMPASLYQSVRKRGRTTLHTIGVITGLSEDIRVRYGNKHAYFEDQLAIVGAGGMFSDGYCWRTSQFA